jgi:ribonuclease HII
MSDPTAGGRKRTTKAAEARARAAARRRAERRRLKKLLLIEEAYWEQGLQYIAGVDEAGRGPLAGPVVAAAVILPRGLAISGVDDCKKLTPETRERLAVEIRRHAIALGVAAASSAEVDRLNILRATHLAMLRAVRRLPVQPEHILVDGRPVPELGETHTAIVKGDELVHGIACASIVAKVVRDRLMRRLSPRYPGYGWEQNVGYATRAHREAVERLGLTPHHRRSFLPDQLTFDLGE